VDHGAQTETTRDAQVLFNAYMAFAEKGNRIQVKPGDVIPIKGIEVKVLSSAGNLLESPLPGAGQPDAECAGFQRHEVDTTENAQSVGLLIAYGGFRMIDLADLTWNKEYDLVCPANKIGAVDLYLISHHGMDLSGSPQLVHALHPRVAIMNNGARKGGAADTWQTVHDSPGLLDLWQLHFAVAGGQDHNSPAPFIANVDDPCEGKWLRATVRKDGGFTVYNSRNKYEKSY
jgi:hypothetical protein